MQALALLLYLLQQAHIQSFDVVTNVAEIAVLRVDVAAQLIDGALVAVTLLQVAELALQIIIILEDSLFFDQQIIPLIHYAGHCGGIVPDSSLRWCYGKHSQAYQCHCEREPALNCHVFVLHFHHPFRLSLSYQLKWTY